MKRIETDLNAEMRNDIKILLDRTARIDSKLEGIHSTLNAHSSDIEKLKTNQNRAAGAVAVISTMLGLIGGFLAKIFFR